MNEWSKWEKKCIIPSFDQPFIRFMSVLFLLCESMVFLQFCIIVPGFVILCGHLILSIFLRMFLWKVSIWFSLDLVQSSLLFMKTLVNYALKILSLVAKVFFLLVMASVFRLFMSSSLSSSVPRYFHSAKKPCVLLAGF